MKVTAYPSTTCRLAEWAVAMGVPGLEPLAHRHMGTCPHCLAANERLSVLTSRLATAAGPAAGLPEPLVASILRSARLEKRRKQKPQWLYPAGFGTALASLVLVAYLLPTTPKLAPNPAAGFAQVGAGADQIATAFASIGRGVPTEKWNTFAATVPGLSVPQRLPRSPEPTPPNRLTQLRNQVDPLGLTDDTKWQTVRKVLSTDNPPYPR